MSYKVEEVTNQVLPPFLNARKTLAVPGGLQIRGEFEIVCREANGEDVWSVKQPNLLTDYGRRFWMENRYSSARIAFSQSTEPPNSTRYAITCDASNSLAFTSVGLAPTNDVVTFTKTFSTTFPSPPPVTRTLGSILLCTASTNLDTNLGIYGVCAYAVLTPAKTQTTTQTLEVVYRLSMTPIS